jgi:hypothetical protein
MPCCRGSVRRKGREREREDDWTDEMICAGSQCAHDHHGLLHAGDERLRPPEAGEGVGGAAGDPGGDHVIGELTDEDPAVSGGGR